MTTQASDFERQFYQLIGALRRLLSELSAVQVAAVREFCGNTNANVLQMRIDEASIVLRDIDGL